MTKRIELIQATAFIIRDCLTANGIMKHYKSGAWISRFAREEVEEHFQHCLVCQQARLEISKDFDYLKDVAMEPNPMTPTPAPTIQDLLDRGEIKLDTRVLGTPTMTNDGALRFEDAMVYVVWSNSYDDKDNREWKVSPAKRDGNPEDRGLWWEIEGCDCEYAVVKSVWSTRSAAESAARAEKEKHE